MCLSVCACVCVPVCACVCACVCVCMCVCECVCVCFLLDCVCARVPPQHLMSPRVAPTDLMSVVRDVTNRTRNDVSVFVRYHVVTANALPQYDLMLDQLHLRMVTGCPRRCGWRDCASVCDCVFECVFLCVCALAQLLGNAIHHASTVTDVGDVTLFVTAFTVPLTAAAHQLWLLFEVLCTGMGVYPCVCIRVCVCVCVCACALIR